eukprot:1144916-Pelagomonas_calceolata.AAC.18
MHAHTHLDNHLALVPALLQLNSQALQGAHHVADVIAVLQVHARVEYESEPYPGDCVVVLCPATCIAWPNSALAAKNARRRMQLLDRGLSMTEECRAAGLQSYLLRSYQMHSQGRLFPVQPSNAQREGAVDHHFLSTDASLAVSM